MPLHGSTPSTPGSPSASPSLDPMTSTSGARGPARSERAVPTSMPVPASITTTSGRRLSVFSTATSRERAQTTRASRERVRIVAARKTSFVDHGTRAARAHDRDGTVAAGRGQSGPA